MRQVACEDLQPGMVIKKGTDEMVFLSPNASTTTLNIIDSAGKVRTIPKEPTVSVVSRKHPMKGITITNEMILGTSTTAGTDPEILTVDARGEVIPSWEFLPHKNQAIATDYNAKAFWDGFQSEFTVTPTHCHGHLTDYVRSGLNAVIKKAREKDPNARLTIQSAVRIPRETLLATDPEHVQLGCSPSRNIYEEGPLELPHPTELEYRFAGCHLHYGSVYLTPQSIHGTVWMLDAVAGVANVALGAGFLCPQRREYYGKAGEFRYHGDFQTKRLEWRVPDTILLSHPATFNLMVDLARQAAQLGGKGMSFLVDAEEREVRDAINYCDVELARKIIKRNDNLFRVMFERQYFAKDVVNKAMDALYAGIDSVVADPTAVEENWELLDWYNGDHYWHTRDFDRSTTAGKSWSGACNHKLSIGEKV